jgi:hypothetical protein
VPKLTPFPPPRQDRQALFALYCRISLNVRKKLLPAIIKVGFCRRITKTRPAAAFYVDTICSGWYNDLKLEGKGKNLSAGKKNNLKPAYTTIEGKSDEKSFCCNYMCVGFVAQRVCRLLAPAR